MKNYLNKNERSDVIMLAALLGFLQDTFTGWDKRGNLTKEEGTRLKTAITHTTKMVDSIMGRLDKKFGTMMMRDAKNTKIFTLPNEKADKMLAENKAEEEKDVCVVRKKALDYLAEKALANCNPCNCKDEETCPLRICFTELTIDVFDTEATGCPYKIS